MEKTLKEIDEILRKHGFEIPDGPSYEYLSGELVAIDYEDKENKKISVSTHYTDELIDIVSNMDEDSTYNVLNYSDKIIVDSILIYSEIVNVPNFYDGEKEGIYLSDNDKYIPTPLVCLERCIEIQKNPLKHSINIFKKHIKNYEFFEEHILPAIDTKQYYCSYNSLIDLNERETLVPNFTYEKEGTSLFGLYFETDIITGEFKVTTMRFDYDKGEQIIRDFHWVSENEEQEFRLLQEIKEMMK